MVFFFFFNDTATTEIYTLSLHDALPICPPNGGRPLVATPFPYAGLRLYGAPPDKVSGRGQCVRVAVACPRRSEEHTSELQSRQYLVCRLLLEKKKNINLVSHLLTLHSTL